VAWSGAPASTPDWYLNFLRVAGLARSAGHGVFMDQRPPRIPSRATELLTLTEARKRLGMSKTKFHEKVMAHEIKVVRDERWVRVPDWALEEWIRNTLE
jgi:excisionase family DNA binding protein